MPRFNQSNIRHFALLLLPLAFSGCQLFGFGEEVSGHPVSAQYKGLDNKSVAIVIYADQATTNEFPAAREELSAFLASKMREHLPTIKLLDYHEVMNWQDDTMNWFGLTEKQIGQHFSVDRVLYIELLDYSVAASKGFGEIQGHIRANCKVTEVDSPSNSPAWTSLIDVRYPQDHPVDPSQTSPDALRASLLQKFADQLTNRFYDHNEIYQAVPQE
ncbi:MAG: hypothetical protein ACTHN5_07025 [Phycisphaerae bacterium]